MNLPLEVSSWNIPEKLLRTTGDQKVRFSQNDSPKSILIEELGNNGGLSDIRHSLKLPNTFSELWKVYFNNMELFLS